MYSVPRMGLFACALIGGSLLGAGCSSQVSGGEKTSQGSLAEEKPVDPGGTPGCPPGKPPPSDCTGGQLGDGVTCQDGSSIKQLAFDACAQAGLQLSDISGVTTDGCSGGEWTKLDYTCCPAPPAPPPNQCTNAELGDGTTCEDLAVIKQQVSDLCAQSGLNLTGLKGSTDGCPGGGWSKTYYQCCAPTPPKGGGGSCTEGKLGDGTTCQDPSALEQQAADACAAAGLPLTGVKAPSDCPGGQSTWAEYICCSP
jgi:hypothetical protein